MLKALAALLLLANGLWALWANGALAPLGLAPDDGREPHRLQAQIAPQKLNLVQTNQAQGATKDIATLAPTEAPDGALAGVAPAPDGRLASQPTSAEPSADGAVGATGNGAASRGTAAACWQSGVLTAAAGRALQPALTRLLGAQGWRAEGVNPRARWVVYMGRFATAAELDRKRAQLAVLGVAFSPLRDGPLAPGLSLGVYSSAAGAEQALAELARQGVRTARVVPEPAPDPAAAVRLRFDAISPAQQQALRGVPGLGALGACDAEAAAAPTTR